MKDSKKAKNTLQDKAAIGVALPRRDAVDLVPQNLFYYLIFISLVLPNLIYSGTGWFDTLHIMKWTFTMVPIGIAAVVGGVRLMYYGPERTSFNIDLFGWLWLLLLGYISAQALWVHIVSVSAFVKEWFFMATLLGTYILTYNCFKSGSMHRLILWGANINAAINVLFAEILIRNANAGIPFIMNVPGNYIGNTGQQEMFGLWMAIALMNGVYLQAFYSNKENPGSDKIWLKAANIFLIAVNAWGLWTSTTMGAMLSIITGIIIFSLMIMRLHGHSILKKIGVVAAVLVIMLGAMLAIGKATGYNGRYDFLLFKVNDVLRNPGNIGFRRDIWRSSWAVFTDAPMRGVGIGQFKWHYLDGQRMAFQKHPDMKWQFTYWAHSEYIQWLAEFGIIGGLLLILAGIWWLYSFLSAMVKKKTMSYEAIWGSSIIFLLWFDAIFSRPFHRIEDVIWLAVAFALANRELLPLSFKWSEIRHSSVYRMVGALITVISVSGMIFLVGGMVGDKTLRSAVSTNNAGYQDNLIRKAGRMLMARDDAQEQYAYHLIAVARATHRNSDWQEAVLQLYRSFLTKPDGKKLLDTVNLASQLGDRALLEKVAPYLAPGTFNVDLAIRRAQQRIMEQRKAAQQTPAPAPAQNSQNPLAPLLPGTQGTQQRPAAPQNPLAPFLPKQ